MWKEVKILVIQDCQYDDRESLSLVQGRIAY